MGERSAGMTLVTVLCHMRTQNDGCKIKKQMKVALIFVHSITQISTAPVTEYLNKHDSYFVYTVLK